MDLFVPTQSEWGVTDIAAQLNLSKSSAHALVTSLVEIGLLEREDNRRVRLGHKLLGYGETVLAGSEIFRSMRDLLDELMHKMGRSVYLAVKEGKSIVYVNRLQGSSAVPASLGSATSTLPPHASAAGKVLLAHQPRRAIRQILDGQGLKRFTKKTLTNEGALENELSIVRRQGYALSNGEFVPELYCVAAPVYDDNNQVVASIGIGATARDFELNQPNLIKEVVRFGRLASRSQGWRSNTDLSSK
ncbi:IclR family transcriptional regulator (plasmid) [Agrobacterium tumefaciens]|uniref:IclR family transcriptional regulator n=1 Tax=Agrobacterium tumefaciens TaxID=358 RepID=A0AAJ4TDA3_AGRTU|nr:IclR family transcriptional regulator [Agrobacterium tumefaciens]